MERSAAVERVLRTVEPHALLPELRRALTDRYGALKVDLLMADYAMTILQTVESLPFTTQAVPVHVSAPGRAFASQRAVREPSDSATAVLHLPVSVRGERIGILSVTVPAQAAEPGTEEELAEIAESLGRAILIADRETDLYLQAKRTRRLTLAAEMQWQLLPGSSCSRTEYDMGAQLEPAYGVYGDNVDWSATADDFALTLTNGMGEGIEASLLTSLGINALRNARRAGLSLVDQACLADQAIYGLHHGGLHLSTLLLRFDLSTGVVEVIDAGSPKAWLLREGKVSAVELDAQLPLGMFEDTLYESQTFRVRPGDRLLFLSDGVYDATSPAGERYEERVLSRAMNATRMLPAPEVPRAILNELRGHLGEQEALDDALAVCLDWRGREG
ncbi:PP2C family protein-serine/threonine phosphatase [Streptomyces sp. V4-01]|uniref:PP2C family protein-serine/threonine phosphatase n=1 Tax=Actinacidiphila polyblastidii TaxID=3110430 RepID=A0ABU7P3P8_9ACTN|nr:PP2C family protein-serine/threonine phosphatase [Streptomyces sp. V4-01]